MHAPIKSIRDAGDLRGKRVIARLDLNVPIVGGKIIEDLRIRVSVPTVKYLIEQGAKVILISHIEAKEDVVSATGEISRPTLGPVAVELSRQLGKNVKFVTDFMGQEGQNAVSGLAEGDVILFENLRINDGEKKNDIEFTKSLVKYADVYVNDAFAVSHRAHASVVGLPKLLPHFAGFQLMNEIEHLSAVFNPAHPFIFILGGAKFETKIPLIEKFLKLSECVYVGGALMNDLFKAKGYEIGSSLVSKIDFDIKHLLNDSKLVLPIDVVVKGQSDSVSVVDSDKVPVNSQIVDVGPKSVADFRAKIASAKFILWNGPLGLYEGGFKDQTLAMARTIYETNSASGANVAVGGGDTVAALESLNTVNAGSANPNIFISSGGGAMLQYLLDETLVGIDALKY